MNQKKPAFFFAFTANLAFAAGNCAISLNRHLKLDDYDIVMFHTPLPECDREALRKIPHVVLHEFELEERFVEHMLKNIPPESRFRTRNHLMCFAHFETFRLLRDYTTVVWYDVDIGFQRDCSAILNYGPFGILPDTPWTVANQFTAPVEGYDMTRPGVCTATMVLHDTLPYEAMLKFLYEKAEEYADRLYNPDQAIINIALQEFNITPSLIPGDVFSCFADRDEASTARAVHFGTGSKVWNNTNLCNAFPEWYRTHLEWLELGGSDFDRSLITPRNCVGALNHFDRLYEEDRQRREEAAAREAALAAENAEAQQEEEPAQLKTDPVPVKDEPAGTPILRFFRSLRKG